MLPLPVVRTYFKMRFYSHAPPPPTPPTNNYWESRVWVIARVRRLITNTRCIETNFHFHVSEVITLPTDPIDFDTRCFFFLRPLCSLSSRITWYISAVQASLELRVRFKMLNNVSGGPTSGLLELFYDRIRRLEPLFCVCAFLFCAPPRSFHAILSCRLATLSRTRVLRVYQ